ncbi:MAG: hypothetical protein E7615_01720 [Ruminococcaceae bacterium]|nr:hypothetical protein [Oscillospiraceae bacterium]
MNNNISSEKEKRSRSAGSGRVMDFIAKIACLVVAFFIWFYAMSSDVVTLERDFTVPVVFENEDILLEKTGWSVLSGKGNSIVVTLKGKRNTVNKINDSDIRATVDVSNVEKAGIQELVIKVSAPTECEVVNMSVSSISPNIDKRVTKTVPVKVVYYDCTTPTDQELETVLNVSSVEITGPESELDKVDAAQADLSPGYVTQSLKMTAPLRLVDQNGNDIKSDYVTLNTKTVNVTAKLFASRELILSVDNKYGYFNDNNVSISITPQVITVRGEPLLLEEKFKDGKLVVAVLDEKKFVSDGKQEVPIVLPEGVTLTTTETKAEIDVRHINTDIKTVTVSDIQLKNIGGLDCELQTESLNIMLRGPYDLLSTIGEDDITLTANMKNYSSVTGIMVIPVSVSFSPEYERSVYELESYSVTVNIK